MLESSMNDIPVDDLLKFSKELEQLINKYSLERTCNTPDYILAEHLLGCLSNYVMTHNQCMKWHGRNL